MSPKQKNKLFWIIDHPTHYHIFLTNTINEKTDWDLRFFCYKKVYTSHPWQEVLSSTIVPHYLNSNFLKNLNLLKGALNAKKTDLFVIAGWNNPIYLLIILILRCRKNPLVIWTDTPKKIKQTPSLLQKYKNQFLKFTFQSKNSFLFVTGEIGKKVAQQNWQLKKEQLLNFPFATDIDFFQPKQPPKLSDKVIFLSSGRLDVSKKGYDLAIKAFSILHKKGYNNFAYYIAGTGADEEQLVKQIDEVGLSNFIFFKGWIDFKELPNFYNSGNVLLHPSNYDPFPNAILEAMACGLVVVSSDVAGSAIERIIDGENGFIHAAGNEIELAKKIQKIIDSSTLLSLWSDNARKTAKKWTVNFNLDQLQKVQNKFNNL